ncbi:hypothetical protein PR003_g30686 [Phytophthora rubi]|nr:hypothetical protein PR003_g30686 [Phytophthora rubi]
MKSQASPGVDIRVPESLADVSFQKENVDVGSESAPLPNAARVMAAVARSGAQREAEDSSRPPLGPLEYQAERWRHIKVHQRSEEYLAELVRFLKGDFESFSPRRLRKISKVADLFALDSRGILYRLAARQAMYYNQRNVRNGTRGPGITKFGHRWRGPGKIIEATGYDNYLIQMLESGQELVTHCSFLLSYYYPTHLLEQMAKDIAADLREEAVAAADLDSDDEDGAETEMEAQNEDQNSPEAVGAAVVTSVATEPSHAATPRAATPARAEIAAAADEAAAVESTEQPEADLTPRPDVQQPARRLSPTREQRRRAERPEPAAAAADQDQGRDAMPDRPRVHTKRPRAAPASSSDAIAGRTRAKIR